MHHETKRVHFSHQQNIFSSVYSDSKSLFSVFDLSFLPSSGQNREWLGRKAGTQKQRLQFEGGNGVVTTSPLEQQKFWSQSFTIAHEEMSLRTKTTQRRETSFNITLQSILWLMIHTWINFLLYLQAFHWHATSAKIAKKMSHTYEIICDSVQIQHTLVV